MWKTSSYSSGGNCVEVWRKSTFSADQCVEVGIFKTSTLSATQGESRCVEVGADEDHILVRHSKNHDAGTIPYTYPEWKAFIEGVKAGEFDLP